MNKSILDFVRVISITTGIKALPPLGSGNKVEYKPGDIFTLSEIGYKSEEDLYGWLFVSFESDIIDYLLHKETQE